jgi:hypothetical protein
VWTRTLGKISIMDNLRKRHAILLDLCYMCKKAVKSIAHLLLHWEVARDLWVLILSL